MKKLNIEELKVKSFITNLEEDGSEQTIKGGNHSFLTIGRNCVTAAGHSRGLFCRKKPKKPKYNDFG